MQYRKKPVVIDAIQLTESNVLEVYEWVHGCVAIKTDMDLHKWDDYIQVIIRKGMNIPTLEDGADGRAKHVASVGDYVIKGVQGEFYPCKPEIFEATYEKV